MHPFAPTLPKLLDFFFYLHSSLKLSVAAISGYRSALAPIFKLAGESYDSTVEMDLLFKALKKASPKGGLRPPHWDINIVLFTLKHRPYEPPSAEALREFTMKTLFLIALATAHRVGE